MTSKFKTTIINILIIIHLTKSDKKCAGTYFDGRYFEVNPLKEYINNVTQVIYNRFDNTVYFTYDLLSSIDNNGIGYLKLETQEVGAINGIKKPRAIAINDINGEVYIGGADGIFVVNDQRVPEKLPNLEDDVQNVLFRYGLYYTNKQDKAFEYIKGMATRVPELMVYAANNLVIDDDRNIFFLQDDHLFRIKIGTRAVNSHEKYRIHCMAKDNHNKVYFCTSDGIYRYNKFKYALEKVSSLKSVRGITFDDHNDAIFSSNNSIYKLNLRSVAC